MGRIQPEDEKLTTEEIEAILEREAAGLPPEEGADAKPHELVRQEPGQGKFGPWAVWLIIAFILLGAMQMLR